MLCSKCQAELEADARFCGACGGAVDEPRQPPERPPPRNEATPQAPVVSIAPPRYVSTYETGRLLAKILSFVGWVLVFVGSIGTLVSLSFLLSGQNLSGFALFPLAGSLVAAILGLVLVVNGQAVRAHYDTADFAGETLALAKAAKN